MTLNPDTLSDVLGRLEMLAYACDVTGLDHLPIVSRENAAPFAADLRFVISSLRGSGAEEKRAAWASFDKAKRAGYPQANFVHWTEHSLALADAAIAHFASQLSTKEAEIERLKPYEDELRKIAADVGEEDDPFAAWEKVDGLLRAEALRLSREGGRG